MAMGGQGPEHWYLITKPDLNQAELEAQGAIIKITGADVIAFDLVPCGGIDVRGVPRKTYWVVRGDPHGDNDYQHRDPPDYPSGNAWEELEEWECVGRPHRARLRPVGI
jgi:hypothetical protein